MSKHTPGPWTVKGPLLSYMTASIGAPGMTDKSTLVIAHVDNVDGFKGDSNANARLIAAAPDLLAALEDTLRYLVTPDGFPDKAKRTAEQQQAYDNARTALAAARGENRR